MDNNNSFTNIKDLGEFGLINRLTKNFSALNASTLKSIGDDAAVLRYDDKTPIVLSTDLLVEGIHFDLMYTPLKHLGYKSIIVNLSDIYAMNARPQQVTVSLAVSSRFTVEALEELYDGIQQACHFYGVDLVGGDTTSSLSGLMISVTAIGTAKSEEHIAYRNNARVGDYICMTGNLGAAYLGLQVLEREKQVWKANPDMQPQLDKYTYLVERQLKPEARKDIIDLFEKANIVPHSMIDVSDGLSSDLMHICRQSNVGARIYEENIPIHSEAHKLAFEEFKISPTTCALSGGEDYELLFTVSNEQFQKIDGKADIKVLGNITEKSEGIKLYPPKGDSFDIVAQGWNHFD